MKSLIFIAFLHYSATILILVTFKKKLLQIFLLSLGLSIVEKILNDHNGFIEFISQKEGAKIKILLPKYGN